MENAKPDLKILLAAPRGFCAGVDRAIDVVEHALGKYGAPVYVRHEIVHNRHVVESLREKGAVFVEELDEVPEDVPVVFSAHGVPKSVFSEAESRNMPYLDATCPLVTKVHVDVGRHLKGGKTVIMIGHAGHPEVIGTMGQFKPGQVILVEDAAQARELTVPDPASVAYVTQTTLSVDDTAEVVSILRDRFPEMADPPKDTICYATTNRQAAVKDMAPECDAIVVLGAPNSSNSNRLVEVAKKAGCAKAVMVEHAGQVEDEWLDGVATLGITAGASAPEILVQDLVARLRSGRTVTTEERRVAEENVTFSLPSALTS